MKKLMLALAAVAMAACSQAASIKWTTDVIYGANADGSFTSTYLSKTEGVSGFKVAVTFFAFDSEASEWREVSVTGNEAVTSSTKNGKASGNTVGYDFLINTDYQYAAHYEMTLNGKDYTMDVGPTTFTQTAGTGSFALTVPTASQWSAVPEPTSGLLLLLGVAGLALRRRRA